MSARSVTLVGWAVLAAAAVTLEAGALGGRERFASLGDAVDTVLRTRVGRGILLLGWLWLGWHVFVR